MVYAIEFAPRAVRSVSELLPEAVAAACIEFIFGALAENPRRVGKALHDDLEGRWSARRGQFRVIYEIHDDRVIIRVVDVAHRRDAYR